jgi:hypothetical protein
MIINFPEFKVVDKYRELSKNIFIVDVKLANFEKFTDRTIFSACHSTDGFKLPKFKAQMILSYLNEPTIEKWDNIYKIQVTPGKNLWDSWNNILPKKVICIKNTDILSDKWLHLPTPQELVSGISATIKKEHLNLLNIKQKLMSECSVIELKYKGFIEKYA